MIQLWLSLLLLKTCMNDPKHALHLQEILQSVCGHHSSHYLSKLAGTVCSDHMLVMLFYQLLVPF